MIILSDTEISRFWSHVNIREENECWDWTASKYKEGYGKLGCRGKMLLAHRVAWQIANKREPRDGYEIAHAPKICHNPSCCNPKHLLEKTRLENEYDKKIDGTKPRGNKHGSRTRPESRPRGENHPHAKLTQLSVSQIRELSKTKIRRNSIAAMFGVSRSTIYSVIHNRYWKP